MSFEQTTLLGVIQGLTEFLPVSSSGHLVWMPALLGWKDQGLAMDVALHLGTLGAILVALRRDVWALFWAFISQVTLGRVPAPRQDVRLLWNLVLATIPVVICGLAVDRWIPGHWRHSLDGARVIGCASLCFGLLLYGADRWGAHKRCLGQMSRFEAGALWGVAQVFALIPGASRSGICLTAARARGYTRVEAARFTFLMAIPAVGAAAVLKGWQLIQAGAGAPIGEALWGALVAFVVGLCVIRGMLRWLGTVPLWPFAVYRVVLGIFLLF